ncbi:MAG: RNA polymerase sigma factor [Proteobacteria bacterium]|nr:RNA polymerase sigma factor [Pseudomonadota bacterium]
MNDKPATGFAQDIDAMTLARAQRGDMAAFAQLYQRYARACFQLALRLTGQRQPAEDLVHEAFLKMMDTIGSYRGDAPFGAWFKRLVANTGIDWLRRQRHIAGVDAEEALEHASAMPVDTAGIVDADALLARLPPRARAIVVLHELEGYTHAELAALFGQSESYSKSILARALKRLQGLAATATSTSQVAL